jgi:hypothetical protein
LTEGIPAPGPTARNLRSDPLRLRFIFAHPFLASLRGRSKIGRSSFETLVIHNCPVQVGLARRRCFRRGALRPPRRYVRVDLLRGRIEPLPPR